MLKTVASSLVAFCVSVGAGSGVVHLPSDAGDVNFSTGGLHTHESEQQCWNALYAFEELIYALDVPVSCDLFRPTQYEGAGALYTGAVHLFIDSRYDQQYYQDMLAHELGHAVEYRWLSDEQKQVFLDVVWPGVDREWDGELWADWFAYSIGFWRDYGDGWRHDTITDPRTVDGARKLQYLRLVEILSGDV